MIGKVTQTRVVRLCFEAELEPQAQPWHTIQTCSTLMPCQTNFILLHSFATVSWVVELKLPMTNYK